MTPDVDPTPRPEGEPLPSPENDAYRAMSFYTIHTRILDQKTSDEERQKLIEERGARYTAANNNGLFDDFRTRVNEAIRTNQGVAAETEINKVAQEIEREAAEMNPGYTQENHRMIYLAGRAVVARLRVDRYRRDPNEARRDGIATQDQADRLVREANLGNFVQGIDVGAVGTEFQPVAAQAVPPPDGIDAAKATGAEIGRALSAAIREGQLTSDEAYVQFLVVERRNEAPLNPVSEVGAPMYWRRLTDLEQKMNNNRREINNAAFIKRTQVRDLDTASKNPELPKVQKEEVQRLYEQMPGYREALETWADIFENRDEDDNKIERTVAARSGSGRPARTQLVSVVEIANEAEAEQFKKLVDEKIKVDVRAKVEPKLRRDLTIQLTRMGEYTDEQILEIVTEEVERAVSRTTTEAGQAAFNTLFALNCFESWANRWDGDRWKKTPELHEARLVNDGIREQMHPLNTLISKAHGKEKYGALGAWAVEMLDGISPQDYDEIRVVHAASFEEARQYWTVYDRVLIVPECYPKKMVGSAFDETKVAGQSITEYLVSGKTIPWNSPETSELASKYARTLNHANNFFTFATSVIPVRPGVQEVLWNAPLDKAKVKLDPGLSSDERMKWIVMVQNGVIVYCNVPLMDGGYVTKASAQDIHADPDYNPVVAKGQSVFFEWDGVKIDSSVEKYRKATEKAYVTKHGIKKKETLVERIKKFL